jgi:hypothetical protein
LSYDLGCGTLCKELPMPACASRPREKTALLLEACHYSSRKALTGSTLVAR